MRTLESRSVHLQTMPTLLSVASPAKRRRRLRLRQSKAVVTDDSAASALSKALQAILRQLDNTQHRVCVCSSGKAASILSPELAPARR